MHGWHPFPAKFPPQLPELFIKELTAAGDTVLDPMAGSGTTLVEAVRLGRRAVGCDIDPLALTMMRAKLFPIDCGLMVRVGFSILETAKKDFEKNQKSLKKELTERFNAETLKFINYWFLPETQLELLSLVKEIEKVRPSNARRFFSMIFSSLIIAKSAGVSMARDLAHTRPHKIKDKKPASAFSEYIKRLSYAVKAGSDTITRNDTVLKEAAAQNTGLDSETADLIITSPPYANNAIDYMRAHKFSLVWFKYPIKDLTVLRSDYLGHDSSGKYNKDVYLPPQCEKSVAALTPLSASKAAALRRYFGEMRRVIREMRRLLKTGKHCVIVVASSVLEGVDVETHLGLAAIGEMEGFNLSGIGARSIDRDRRMMPARRNQAPSSQIENRMHIEHVIGLTK